MTSPIRKQSIILTLLAAFALVGCGGDEQTVTPPPPGADVFYTYPFDGQANVSTRSRMVVRVSSPVTNGGMLNSGVVQLSADGTPVPATASVAPGDGRSIVIEPDAELSHAVDYRVDISGLETEDGTVDVPDGGFDFTTRPAEVGPRSLRINDENFVVTRTFPDGTDLPIMDFSAFRFQFSQPIDEQTVQYGTTVSITGPDDSLVEAAIAARGRFLTVDPVEDLAPGVTYTISFTAGMESIYEASLQAPFDGNFEREIVPKKSGPTEKMTLNAPAGGQQSPLTGDTVNLVPVIATLLGPDTRSQQGGDLVTELAFVPNYPEATPIRVPRGTTLVGDALQINLGGEVNAGFDSGDLAVEMITDGTGYLLPNPNSTSPNAPRLLRLLMDVGVRNGNATAHAGFSQDVLHLEVIGQAIVEDGVLVGDGITVVETDLLGVEQAYGTLSFHMEAYKDQETAPAPLEDTAAPFVKSWMPGEDHVDKQRPGDPILVNFNQPMSSVNLRDHITVLADGSEVTDVEIEQEGAVVIINTELDYGVQYDIQLSEDLEDLAGNALMPQTLSFTMPSLANGPQSSPFVHTAYPGFPCVTTGQDLANGHVGYCAGGQVEDDRLPIPTMPANREIRVHFSHPMDEASFQGDGFVVEELDAAGNPVAPVEGKLTFRDQDISFMPSEPWEEDTLYRYVLASNGDGQSNACTPASMICSEDGLPLKTQRLAQDPANAPATDGGGPDMAIIFRGAAPVDSVFAHLDLRNTADLNANGNRYAVDPQNDEMEGNPIDNPDLLKNSIRSQVQNVEGAVSDARVGCATGGADCPTRKFSYLNGALNVEIDQYYTPAEAQAMVDSGELRRALPPEVQANGGVLFYAYPTMVQGSNLIAFSQTSIPGTSADPADTGPLILRVRHQCDARANAAAPSPENADPLPQCAEGEDGLLESWIVEGNDGPVVITTLGTYLDAPELDPVVRSLGIPTPATHNAYSQGLTTGISGPVNFLDDGRMEIAGINDSDVDAELEITAAGLLSGTVILRIPAEGIQLSFLSEAPKR
jgi:hypothetical protein